MPSLAVEPDAFVLHVMALLSFANHRRGPTAQGEQRRLQFFNIDRDILG